MNRQFGRLLNLSLLSMTMLSDPCVAQFSPTIKQQPLQTWSPGKTSWLRTLGANERHLLLAPDEPSGFRPPRGETGSNEMRHARFIAAIQNAWSKGVVERGVEGYTEVLIQCQKEQSPALTTPFMRSDSQQAHCFRF
jgi:hypothetical protein